MRAGRAVGGLVAMAVVAAAVALRLWNVRAYPLLYGFDAKGNWLRIWRVTRDWALSGPHAGWSTADPPLFFYASAALLRAMGLPDNQTAIEAARLAGTLAGLGGVALAAELCRRAARDAPRRMLLAAACLLYLPAHIQASAMLNEEIWATVFTAGALLLLASGLVRPRGPRVELARAATVGALGGLAMLTKVSGVAVPAAAASTVALDAWRRRALRSGATRLAVLLAAAFLAGGWYYAWTWSVSGRPYRTSDQAERHQRRLPPGERRVLDYARVPAATWTDPQVLHPDLLRSVWGSTYTSFWFDGHRHFLPREGEAVRRTGLALGLLALLPTAACAVGMARGLRRARRSPRSPDPPLLLLTAFTLAGYVAFTWRVPAYTAVKGTYLLGLSVPFAFYASETLVRWTAGRGMRAVAVWVALVALAALVATTFTYGLVFEKTLPPGLPWWGLERPGA